MRKTLFLPVLDSAILLCSAIIVVIIVTGGFSLALGSVSVQAHGLGNPLIFLISLLALRRVLGGTFFRDSLGFRLVTFLGIRSQSALRRFFTSPVFRRRVLLGLGILCILTLLAWFGAPLQSGLTGRYYDNPDWSGSPIRIARDRAFDLSRMMREFPDISEYYSIHWSGSLLIPQTGTYQFGTRSDDGSTVTVNGQIVVDNSGVHGLQEQVGTITLSPGIVPVQIRYMQDSVSSDLAIWWTRPGRSPEPLSKASVFAEESITSSQLWRYQLYQGGHWIIAFVWALIIGLVCLGSLPQHVKKLIFFRTTPGKFLMFVVLNGIVLNLIMFWIGQPLRERYDLGIKMNTGWYCTRFLLTSPIHDRYDSWLYLYRAREFLSQPQSTTVYTELNLRQSLKFQYPPTSVLLVEPFRWLTVDQFIRVCNFFSWLMILASIPMLAHLLTLSQRYYRVPALIPDWKARLLVTGIVVVTFYPLTSSFRVGQIQTWLYVCFIGALWAWLTDKKGAAGALVGLICIIKPQMGLIMLWGILRKQWRFVGGVLVTTGVAAAGSLAMYGWANHVDYVRFLSRISKLGESYYPNQSVNGLLHRLLFNGTNVVPQGSVYPPYHPIVYWGTMLSSACLVAAALFWRRKDATVRTDILDLSIAVLSFTMASPIAWAHHYNLILPIFTIVLTATRASSVSPWKRLVLAGTFMLCSNCYHLANALAVTHWNVLQSTLFFGALLFLGYLYYLRLRLSRPH